MEGFNDAMDKIHRGAIGVDVQGKDLESMYFDADI